MRKLFLLVLLLVSVPGLAASKKYVTLPSNQAVLTSTNTAYLSNNNLWKQGDNMSSYIERLGRKTPVGGLVPKKGFSLPSIGTKFKNLAKGNFASIAMSAAISTALAGVGWVMEEGVVVKKKDQPIPFDPNYTYWELNFNASSKGASPDEACANAGMSAYVVKGTTSCDLYYPDANTFWGNYPLKKIDKGCPTNSYYSTITQSCAKYTTAPLTDADFDLFDPWLNKQSAAWISDLLTSMCSGSIGTLKPAECFAQLEVAAKEISGPSSVQGEKSTSTTYRTNADGTTSQVVTETDTKYDLSYGPDYFTYVPKTTTTTAVDGQTTETTTEQEGTDVTDEQGTDPAKEEEEEEPESSISGMGCEAAVSCSGDAIQCAIASTDKDTYCLLDKFAKVDESELKTQVSSDLAGADTKPFEGSEIAKTDLSSLIDTSSRISASCPSFPVLTFSVSGHSGSFDFSEWVAHLCEYASWYGAFLVIFAMRGGVEVIARGFG